MAARAVVERARLQAAAFEERDRRVGAAWAAVEVHPSRSGLRARTKGVRLAQKVQFGPCIPVGIQPCQAEVGPSSGPTPWRLASLSHLGERRQKVQAPERGGERVRDSRLPGHGR